MSQKSLVEIKANLNASAKAELKKDERRIALMFTVWLVVMAISVYLLWHSTHEKGSNYTSELLDFFPTVFAFIDVFVVMKVKRVVIPSNWVLLDIEVYLERKYILLTRCLEALTWTSVIMTAYFSAFFF